MIALKLKEGFNDNVFVCLHDMIIIEAQGEDREALNMITMCIHTRETYLNI